MRAGRGARGQSSVEVALLLPFAFGLLLALVQGGLFVRDQVMLVHAAREAARVAAVSSDLGRVRLAAERSGALDPARLRVVVTGRAGPGSDASVRLDYDSPVRVPVLGQAWRSAHLSATATMRVEQ